MRSTITHFYPSLAFDTKRFDSKRTQIYRWRQGREKLEKATAKHNGGKKKLREVGMGTILTSEQEGEIVLWINDLRGEGVPVSTRMLKMKALEVAMEAGVQQFSASSCWIEGFKGRHRLGIRAATRQGQTGPDNLDAISAAFAIEVQDAICQLGITRVYNAD
ncbi:hypothetical protein BBJ28_00026668 [Nothophytophthora sp. Chile5]|nr:hypothetical protein BBJ28_00026668 [Nothophytophthora sp. Chile5]